MANAPIFNFRKMGYRDEKRLVRLHAEIEHLNKQVAQLPPGEEVDALLDKIAEREEEGETIMLGIVECLPPRYFKDGIDPDKVDYSNPKKLLDSIAYGMLSTIGIEIQKARVELSKNG